MSTMLASSVAIAAAASAAADAPGINCLAPAMRYVGCDLGAGMMRRAVLALGIALVGSTAAWAIEINCGAPLVDVGDARQGPGSSRDVRIAIDEGGLGWQVFHDLNDGRVISRVDQYAVNDLRNPHVSVGKLRRDTAWFGQLHTNRNLLMVGRLYERNSMLYYSEQLRDFRRNSQGDVIMVSTAYCGTDPGGQRMRIVDSSTWGVPAMPEPLTTLTNPVPPAASLAPPDPHPVVAPPATGFEQQCSDCGHQRSSPRCRNLGRLSAAADDDRRHRGFGDEPAS
jgi:hypothetical protein